MVRRPKIIVFLYNRLFDPLVQGNLWLYIESYLSDPENNLKLHVISYEDPRCPLNMAQVKQISEWREKGLEWTPLSWHRGTGLRRKFIDVRSGFLVVARLRLKGYSHILTFGSVAGAFAYLYARALFLRLFLASYEPHSEYAVDNGMWAKHSLQFRLSNVLEKRAACFATVIASGTQFMQERLEKSWKVRGRFIKIPTVANDLKFTFNQKLRDEVRSELGIGAEAKVLIYPGKFGGLYYYEETAWMFRWLLNQEPKLHFLIVTPHEDGEIIGMLNRAGVPASTYSICHSDYPDIHRYYFAADFGIVAVPPGPSKKFISNTKVGEYLCAGLPYLITKGVSEDYVFAQERDVGVVVDDFNESAISHAWPAIRNYLQRDPNDLRSHCRTEGLEYRGFSRLNLKFREAIDVLTASDKP